MQKQQSFEKIFLKLVVWKFKKNKQLSNRSKVFYKNIWSFFVYYKTKKLLIWFQAIQVCINNNNKSLMCTAKTQTELKFGVYCF